jgi:hypothetical protein
LQTMASEAAATGYYVDSALLPVTEAVADLQPPDNSLYIFGLNIDGTPSDQMVAGCVITSVYSGAKIGFDLAAFKVRLDTLHTALGVS